MVNDKFNVMVAVCTRNRYETLRRCIVSIQACRPPKHANTTFVIFDNSDTLARREQNQAIVKSIPGYYEIGIIDVPEPGLSKVRNRALDEADKKNQQALIFIDDDQSVPTDWLETMLRVWHEEDCEAVKSSVRFEFEGDGRYGEFFKEPGGDDKASLPQRRPLKYTSTNGVLISSRLFSREGLRFSNQFNLSGGEDFDFFLQSSSRGGRHIATSECWITEFIPAAKETMPWLMRRQFQVGFAQTRVVGPHEGKGRLYCFSSGVLRVLCHIPQVLLFAIIPLRALHNLLNIVYGLGQIWGAFGLSWSPYRNVIGH